FARDPEWIEFETPDTIQAVYDYYNTLLPPRGWQTQGRGPLYTHYLMEVPVYREMNVFWPSGSIVPRVFVPHRMNFLTIDAHPKAQATQITEVRITAVYGP